MQRQTAYSRNAGVRARAIVAAIATGMIAGACSSGTGVTPLDSLLGSAPQQTADASAAAPDGQTAPKTELDRAIEHWGEQYKKTPHDVKAALAYARNLKAAGHKQQAYSVLQSASILHGDSQEVASEYGRLALEFDQIALAEKLLAQADDPTKPDWRLVSARGTVFAKQGKYAESIPFYERALSISPNQPSVMNNLAMAHAAVGDSTKAEQILRQASTGRDPKIKQNLALVVGLQGKHDEAKLIAAANMPAEAASSDADYIKRMVKPTPAAAPAQAMPAVVTKPGRAAAPPARVIEAKSPARPANVPASDDSFRPAGSPSDVAGPAGAWSTSVSKTR